MLRALPYINIYNKKFIDIKNLRNDENLESNIMLFANTFDLFKNDLKKTSSWGILNNEYYLIDYGCNNPSSDEFYKNLMLNNA